jgi:hypothetical protein
MIDGRETCPPLCECILYGKGMDIKLETIEMLKDLITMDFDLVDTSVMGLLVIDNSPAISFVIRERDLEDKGYVRKEEGGMGNAEN